MFAALGDDTRFHLVSRLSWEGPLSITSLSEGAGVTRQAVTKHLHVLQDAGLVSGSRRGRLQIWELRPSRLEEARQYLDAVSRQWDRALQRLRELVETPQ
jgi:DNA-binding transcriptional ArsR family regulator